MKYDVILVGGGNANTFFALEYMKQNPDARVLIVEKGKMLDKRKCPKKDVCLNCKTCAIIYGNCGSGSFSDSKLTLSAKGIGGDFPQVIGKEVAEEYIEYLHELYIRYGADTKVEGIENQEEIENFIEEMHYATNLDIITSPILHLGTEKSQEIYRKIEKELKERGVEFMSNVDVVDVIIEDNIDSKRVIGVVLEHERYPDHAFKYSDNVIIGTGRSGANLVKKICDKYNIEYHNGIVDIGFRLEHSDRVMKKLNELFYEAKLIGEYPFKTRMFCTNPSGFMAIEQYDDNIKLANGHAYKELKSNNTNFAVLVSVEMDGDTLEYAKSIARTCNTMGKGKLVMQRYVDLANNEITKEEQLRITPTTKDYTLANIGLCVPKEITYHLFDFVNEVDRIVPDFRNEELLVYAPEIKFYTNKVKIDENCESSIKGLRFLGDCSGWTRGLMMSAVMGTHCARRM